MGACWLHCCGPIHHARILSSGFGSVLTLTSRSGEGPRLQTTNVWAWAEPTSGKALWGWISLVQNHKRCTPGSLYNSWCQREKLRYALLMRAKMPETAVQSSLSFFSWHHMVFFLWSQGKPRQQLVCCAIAIYSQGTTRLKYRWTDLSTLTPQTPSHTPYIVTWCATLIGNVPFIRAKGY